MSGKLLVGLTCPSCGEVLTGYAKGRGISHGEQAAVVETVPAKAYDYFR